MHKGDFWCVCGGGGGCRRRMEGPATLTPRNNDALGTSPAIPRVTQSNGGLEVRVIFVVIKTHAL